MKKYLLLASLLLWAFCNPILAVTDEQLGNKAAATEKKTEKKENTEKKEKKEPEKSAEQKKRDEDFTVHKTGEGHGGEPTSGGFKP